MRDPGMRVVIEALAQALPTAMNILAIVLALMTVFAIVGMWLFLGSFASCSDETIMSKSECIGTDSEDLPRAWLNPDVGNFDSFGDSMLTLFQAATGDTLPDLIYQAMDAVGIDKTPVATDWSWSGLYFIAWLLVGNFMCLSLFVGAIVDNFRRIRAESDGTALLSAEQVQWVTVMNEARHRKAAKPPLPPTMLVDLRTPCYKIVLTPQWANVTLTIIVLNVVLLSFDYHQIEADKYIHLTWVILAECFYYFYWFEFLVKIFGLGPQGYFQSSARQFEFSMILASVAERWLSAMEINPMVYRMLRVSRALRILRVLQGKNMGDLRNLIHTLVASGPAIANVASILGLVIFIYAVLGLNIFTFVMQNNGLNNHANFESFGGACLLLFQVLTGDSWSGVMHGAMIGADLEEHGGVRSECDADQLRQRVEHPVLRVLYTYWLVHLPQPRRRDRVGELWSGGEAERRASEERGGEFAGADRQVPHRGLYAPLVRVRHERRQSDPPRSPAVHCGAARVPLWDRAAAAAGDTAGWGEDATEAAAAIAAIAAGPGNDQLTWVPEVPEKDLEAAREVITKVRASAELHKHSLSTADQVHFQEALRGQIEYAFRYPLGVEVAMIDEVLIRKKAAKKAAAEEPDSESSEDSDEEEVRQSRKRWRRLSAWTA